MFLNDIELIKSNLHKNGKVFCDRSCVGCSSHQEEHVLSPQKPQSLKQLIHRSNTNSTKLKIQAVFMQINGFPGVVGLIEGTNHLK